MNMRTCMLIASTILFFLSGCKQDPATDGGQAVKNKVQPIGSISAPFTQPLVWETEVLTTETWVAEFYLDFDDPVTSKKNKGRWYQFDINGTFVSGQWQEQNASGSWTYDTVTKHMIVDSTNDAEDGEWRLQIARTGDEMVWIGTPTYNKNDRQVKMIQLTSQPTKKQFGVEE